MLGHVDLYSLTLKVIFIDLRLSARVTTGLRSSDSAAQLPDDVAAPSDILQKEEEVDRKSTTTASASAPAALVQTWFVMAIRKSE